MNGKRGRSEKDEELEMYYLVKAEIEVDQQAIAQKHDKLRDLF